MGYTRRRLRTSVFASVLCVSNTRELCVDLLEWKTKIPAYILCTNKRTCTAGSLRSRCVHAAQQKSHVYTIAASSASTRWVRVRITFLWIFMLKQLTRILNVLVCAGVMWKRKPSHCGTALLSLMKLLQNWKRRSRKSKIPHNYQIFNTHNIIIYIISYTNATTVCLFVYCSVRSYLMVESHDLFWGTCVLLGAIWWWL